jgi:hypothetical protein
MGFLITILFLFAVIGLVMATSLPQPYRFVTDTASCLIFAVARDGVLSLSSWISKVDNNKQPRNAVTVMYIFCACLLCTILPSQVAFTSLTSAGGVLITAGYGLIALLRLIMTPDGFKWSKFKLGRFAKYCYATAFFNAIVFAVEISPFFFSVTAPTFNFVSPLSKHDCFPRGYMILTVFSPLQIIGCGDLWCSHHLRYVELVVNPRRPMASHGTSDEGATR